MWEAITCTGFNRSFSLTKMATHFCFYTTLLCRLLLVHCTVIPVTKSTVTDCPRLVNIICPPLCVSTAEQRQWCTGSRNHSFSSDKDLPFWSLHDEWSVEMASLLRGWAWRWTWRGWGKSRWCYSWPNNVVFLCSSLVVFEGCPQ